MRMSAPDPMQILLVEDNTSDALLVEELLSILEHPTFHVQHAARLGTAEEILAQSEFDAALLDLGLPDSQGLETVRNFQAMADLPIVVLTGQDDQLTGTEAIHLGAQDFLPKAELTEQLLARALRYAVERHRLEQERRLWAKAFDASEPMLITDTESTILGVNTAFTEVTGFSADEVIGKSPKILRSSCHDESFFRAIWDHVRESGHWSGEIWNQARSGETLPLQETITAVTNGQGLPTHYVAIFHDIRDRKQLEAELEELATHDRLTGILSRGRTEELLAHEVTKADRYAHPLGVLLFDVDHFKDHNDRHGHPAGDAVLQELTARAARILRRSDIFGRWGGEEFLVVLPDTDSRGLGRVAEKLRETMACQPFETVGEVTISLGTTQFRTGDNMEAVVTRTDQALYKAKESGRNRVVRAEDSAPAAGEPDH